MPLTRGQLRALKLLVESEDKEIVCDGRHCMIDLDSISRGTVNALLAHMAITDAGYGSVGCDIYKPTHEAPKILARPALADEIVLRVIQSRPFYIDAQGFIQDADLNVEKS